MIRSTLLLLLVPLLLAPVNAFAHEGSRLPYGSFIAGISTLFLVGLSG
jgi:hypothetical protein